MHEAEFPTAEELYTRQHVCLRAGVSVELMVCWTWLWREAGYASRRIRFTSAELGAGVGKGDRAALKSVKAMEEARLISIVEIREGHGGGNVAEIFDPLAVFDERLRPARRPSPQIDFPFVEDAAEEDQEDRDSFNSNSSAPSSSSLRVVGRENDDVAVRLAGRDEVNSNSSARWSSSCLPGEVVDPNGEGAAESPLPLAAKLRLAVGADWFDSLFSGQRLALEGARLTVYAATPFAEERIRRNRRVVAAAGLAIEPAFELAIVGDFDPGGRRSPRPPGDFVSPLNSNSSARSSSSCAQTTTVCLSGSFLGPDKQTTSTTGGPSPLGARPPNESAKRESQSRKPATREGEGEAPLLREAGAIYAAIGDPSCFKWVAIAAAIYVREGLLSQAELDELCALYRGTPSFAANLKALVRSRRATWLTPVQLAPRLKRDFGIPWKAKWRDGESGPAPRNRKAR